MNVCNQAGALFSAGIVWCNVHLLKNLNLTHFNHLEALDTIGNYSKIIISITNYLETSNG